MNVRAIAVVGLATAVVTGLGGAAWALHSSEPGSAATAPAAVTATATETATATPPATPTYGPPPTPGRTNYRPAPTAPVPDSTTVTPPPTTTTLTPTRHG